MTEDPDERREREFDTITFILAGILTAVILVAVGYGIYNSPKVAMTIPSPVADSQSAARPGDPNAPPATSDSR
jgi:hypothetical protein